MLIFSCLFLSHFRTIFFCILAIILIILAKDFQDLSEFFLSSAIISLIAVIRFSFKQNKFLKTEYFWAISFAIFIIAFFITKIFKINFLKHYVKSLEKITFQCFSNDLNDICIVYLYLHLNENKDFANKLKNLSKKQNLTFYEMIMLFTMKQELSDVVNTFYIENQKKLELAKKSNENILLNLTFRKLK